jgi:pyruvate dehydrogenase E1 component alpha subunit
MEDGKALVQMYRTMATIRRFEEEVERLFKAQEIPGFIHLSIGQEAVAVGTCFALKDGDVITSTHRGHHYCIAKGVELKPMMAELFGRKAGLQRGKGGSMHVSDFGRGVFGGYGIVGGGIPVAAGVALACKLQGLETISVAFFSDGACNTGVFYESLNMAAVWNLPMIFMCDNNQWAVQTPVKAMMTVKEISDRAKAHDIPGITVDGNDVVGVYRAAQEAAQRARGGEGPTLINAKTYRIGGHFVGDPEHNRSKEEIEEWRKKGPIRRLGAKLQEEGILNEDDIANLEVQVSSEIEDAIDFARRSPLPEPEEALQHVFGGVDHDE